MGIWFALVLLPIAGCENYDLVDKSQQLIVDKSQYEAIKKTDLEKLRAEAEIGRSVGRYQLHRVGYRTWRLDTATGKTCLLFSTKEDWKTEDAQASACPAE